LLDPRRLGGTEVRRHSRRELLAQRAHGARVGVASAPTLRAIDEGLVTAGAQTQQGFDEVVTLSPRRIS